MQHLPPPAPPTVESHHRQIVESAVDYAIVGADLQGRVVSWNEGARRVLGWTQEEMSGQTVHRFFTPEDVAAGVVEDEMEEARTRGRAADERWHLRKSGERFWASGELMPLRDADGAITGYVKILRDRTEQRLARARLQEVNNILTAGEARLQLAVETGGMAVWQADLKTNEIRWWPGMHALHGLPPDTRPLPMADYYDLILPEDRERVASVLRGTLRRESEQRVEYRVRWPDASLHWLEGRGRVLLDERGKPWSFAGVCMDITARKKTEADLKFLAQASAELAALDDCQATLDRIAHLAVPRFADWCVVDMLSDTGTVQRVAVAHVDPAKQELAKDLYRRYPPDPERITGGIWNILRTGQAECVQDLPDETLAATVRDPDHLATLRTLGLRSYIGVPLAVRGRTLGAIAFVAAESGRRYTADDLALAQDLAGRAAVAIENAALLQTLRESDRAKDVFLATLAHELRNPLAPVWNGLSIIKQVPADVRRVEQIADMIERQVGQITRLVDDLLDVSRINTGKIELKKQHTNLVSILGSALETSRPHIEAAQHRLSVRFPDEPTDLDADPVRLAQVFSNLLNNAAKYTRQGDSIEVAVDAEAERFVVRIRDNGAGIPPEMLGKVFSLFTQVTHPAERSQGGLGIGLSLVEGLVRLHGGSVEARSEGLGKGSEFIVYLPRTRHAAFLPTQPPAGRAMAGNAASAPRRVLVVDDNRDAADTLAELLRMLGNEVLVAHDGTGALACAPQFKPDVVLLDIGLPDLNGYEVARQLRHVAGMRQPRLIALTGWGQYEDKRRAADAGFDDHWTKPVDPARLQELSRNLRP